MSETGSVLAIAAHPDDIEFMMGGTLLLLRDAGWEIHYLNIANGCCGSSVMGREETAAVRTQESRNSCSAMGASFYEPLVDDLEIAYSTELLARVCSVVRRVSPTILLAQSPEDYMEDHMNSVRLAVSAAFCRCMPNFKSNPDMPIATGELAVYHAMPYGLEDSMRRRIEADFYVDIAPVIDAKRTLLECHRSQKEWLDVSQGLDSYTKTMVEMSHEVGLMSGRHLYAEGWRRHSHLGFCKPEFDPLAEVLADSM